MKRAILIAVLAIFALPPLAATASESFTLTIPQRFDPSQETGEVRILLSLSAAPSGSQLVVNNTTTLNLGTTQTVAGDSVSFETAPGNRVMIRYRPLSNFSGDFCSGAGAVEKNVGLRFSGAQNVVDYRVSSFVVGAPAAECSQVSRRIADLPAVITPAADAVAPALDATYMGRLPLDVMLVLDKSGSMGELPPGVSPASTTTKEMILKSAAKAFVANWMAIDAPTGGLNWDEDRMGVVFFSSVATSQSVVGADPPANFFLKRGAGWTPLLAVIDSLTPGGSTSIGAGINAAMQQWTADPAHDSMAIVVTDGMQNTAPLIAPAASGFLGVTPVSGLDPELRKRFIPIQTIGFGTPEVVDETLLRNISFETAGRSYMAIDANTMYDTFAMTLVSVLKGNTASIATRSAKPVTPVLVDRSARRVVFSLQWAPPFVNALDLEVLRPNATKVATPANIQNLPQAEIQSFDLEKPSQGVWTARVVRNPRFRERAVPPHTLNVFFLERHLDYRLSVERQRLRAEISYDGKPLTGLPAGAIRVRVLRPQATLESVLRRTKGTPRRPTPGDPQSPRQLALTALTAADLAQLRPSEAERVILREEKRGIYTADVSKPAIPGSYAYEFTLEWTDPRTGRIHREERVEEVSRQTPTP